MLPFQLFLTIVLLFHYVNSSNSGRPPLIFPPGSVPPQPAVSSASPLSTRDEQETDNWYKPDTYPPNPLAQPSISQLPTENPIDAVAPSETNAEKIIVVYPLNQAIPSGQPQPKLNAMMESVYEPQTVPVSQPPPTLSPTNNLIRRTTMQRYSTPFPTRYTTKDLTSLPISTTIIPQWPTRVIPELTTKIPQPTTTTLYSPTTASQPSITTTPYLPTMTSQPSKIKIPYRPTTTSQLSTTTTPYWSTTTSQPSITTTPYSPTTSQPSTTTTPYSPTTSQPSTTTTPYWTTTTSQPSTTTTPYWTTTTSQPSTTTTPYWTTTTSQPSTTTTPYWTTTTSQSSITTPPYLTTTTSQPLKIKIPYWPTTASQPSTTTTTYSPTTTSQLSTITTTYAPTTTSQPPTTTFSYSPTTISQPLTTTTPYPTTTTRPLAIITSQPTIKTPQPTTTTSKQIQTPINFTCKRSNQYIANANECDSYIECKEYVAVKKVCPDGLQYNKDTIWPDYPCSYPSEVRCADGALLRPASPTAECPRQHGFFSINDGDCSKYIMCQNGVANIMNCPYGLVFNDIISSCDWPINVPSCNPEAFKNFKCPKLSTDYTDQNTIIKYKYSNSCNKYIACQMGFPRLLSCDPGLSFDENVQACVDSTHVTDCAFTYE